MSTASQRPEKLAFNGDVGVQERSAERTQRSGRAPHLLQLARSAAGGGAATVVDLLMLRLLVDAAHWSPRAASIPALLAGSVTMYFTQKYGAFRSGGRPTGRELALFALVQLGGLLITGWIFDASVRWIPFAAHHYLVARLVVSNLVWLLYSYPLWHLVFRHRVSAPRVSPERS